MTPLFTQAVALIDALQLAAYQRLCVYSRRSSYAPESETDERATWLNRIIGRANHRAMRRSNHK